MATRTRLAFPSVPNEMASWLVTNAGHSCQLVERRRFPWPFTAICQRGTERMIDDHAATTVRSDTQSIAIAADPDQVFTFVADPGNLPTWAVGFCHAIRHDAELDRWIVTTAQGEMPIRYVTDATARTIDFYFEPSPGGEVAAFSRVVPSGQGSDYIFTQFQTTDMPDAVFEAQTTALGEELHVLRGVLQARAACRR